MGCLGTDGRCATCRTALWPMVGRQAVTGPVWQRHVQVPTSGKSVTWLAASRGLGCRSGTGCEQVCFHMILRRLGVNNIQTRSKRLGLGLTASAPHHRPRGHLHPHERERLDFGCAEDLLVPCFPFDFLVAPGARALVAWLACPATGAH